MIESAPSSFWVVRMTAEAQHADAFSSVLEGFCASVSLYEESSGAGIDHGFVIEGFSESKLDLPQIQETLVQEAEELGCAAPVPTLEERQNRDWLKESFESFPPLSIGSFYLYGSHHPVPTLAPEQLGILMDAATAFGSGWHETTQGCLQALEDLAQKQFWNKSLDLGCGSGILALGMAALSQHRPGGPVPVVACDNDPEAVRVARQNAVLNHLDFLVQVHLSEGFDAPAVQQAGPYDLIVANILAEPLKILAPLMKNYLVPRGTISAHVILSGILNSQAPSVEESYVQQGLTVNRRYVLGTWTTLVLSH